MKKIALIFGGKSAEHEISIRTMRNIVDAIDPNEYKLIPIGIDLHGEWYHFDMDAVLQYFATHDELEMSDFFTAVEFHEIGIVQVVNILKKTDLAFPCIHGPLVEDGHLQGLLRMIDLPFVGSGVLGSAIGMDKAISKILARSLGLQTANFIVVEKGDVVDPIKIINQLSLPLFVKPLSLGSSVGISKVYSPEQLVQAIAKAHEFDTKVILENYIRGVEIEVGLIGNKSVTASMPVLIRPRHDFYTYEAKYIDPQGIEFELPANLPPQLARKLQESAIVLFKLFNCSGFARVDFFVTEQGAIVFNELNTIPGFYEYEHVSKIMGEKWGSYKQLVTKLIELGMEKGRDSATYQLNQTHVTAI